MDVDWCTVCGRHTRGRLYCSAACMESDGGALEDVDDGGRNEDAGGGETDSDGGESDADDGPPTNGAVPVVNKETKKSAAGASSSLGALHPRRSSAPETLARRKQLLKAPLPWVKAYDDEGPDDDEPDPFRFEGSLAKNTIDGTFHQVQAFKARRKAIETERSKERKALEDSRNFLKTYQKQRVWVGSGLPASSSLVQQPSIPVGSSTELDPSLFLRTYDYGMSPSEARYQRDDAYLDEVMRQPWYQSSQ